jgi:hypothetical protein
LSFYLLGYATIEGKMHDRSCRYSLVRNRLPSVAFPLHPLHSHTQPLSSETRIREGDQRRYMVCCTVSEASWLGGCTPNDTHELEVFKLVRFRTRPDGRY